MAAIAPVTDPGEIPPQYLLPPDEERAMYQERENGLIPRQMIIDEDGHPLPMVGAVLPSLSAASETTSSYAVLGGTYGKTPSSLTHKTVTLSIYGKPQETLTMSVVTCTKVSEVLDVLQSRLGFQEGAVHVLTKQGPYWRTLRLDDQVPSKGQLKGISSFKRRRKEYAHPHCVVGAGYMGIKHCQYLLKQNQTNFVLLERRSRVGGMAWLEQANKTSKLQTELGAYHSWWDWGPEGDLPESLKDYPPWPSRDQLLHMFQTYANDKGVMPYIRFNTEWKSYEIQHVKDQSNRNDFKKQYYNLRLDINPENPYMRIGDSDRPAGRIENIDVASVIAYPGNLAVPRREDYKNEDSFGCPITYGICNAFSYGEVTDKEVVLVGHGAFCIENLRTCLEHGAKKCYLVCRRTNIACPRMVSWAANAAHPPMNGSIFMEALQIAYDPLGVDIWDHWTVSANATRTTANIRQKSRFGIGDVYFLSQYMGVCEVIVGGVKRLSPGTVHLHDGRTLPCAALLKMLGFVGDKHNDNLFKVKYMNGFHVNNDHRLVCWAEAIGVSASNFASTSFASPGCNDTQNLIHFLNYPDDYYSIADQCPKRYPEPESDRPTYVLDAQNATILGMVWGSVPAIAERSMWGGELKRIKQLKLHPLRQIISEAAAEWASYAKTWKDRGAPGEIPPYPYTVENVQALLDKRDELYAHKTGKAKA